MGVPLPSVAFGIALTPIQKTKPTWCRACRIRLASWPTVWLRSSMSGGLKARFPGQSRVIVFQCSATARTVRKLATPFVQGVAVEIPPLGRGLGDSRGERNTLSFKYTAPLRPGGFTFRVKVAEVGFFRAVDCPLSFGSVRLRVSARSGPVPVLLDRSSFAAFLPSFASLSG